MYTDKIKSMYIKEQKYILSFYLKKIYNFISLVLVEKSVTCKIMYTCESN